MTVRALSRARDADAVIVRLEGERELLRLPRFWETEDGIVDLDALLLKLKGTTRRRRTPPAHACWRSRRSMAPS